MATIKFYIQSKKNPAGIYIRLRDGIHIDAKAKTKFVINPIDWSSSKGQPKNLKDESFKKLDQDLTDLKSDLLKHYNESVKHTSIDSKWLKDFISPPIKKDAVPSLLVDYFDYYSTYKKTDLQPSSFKKLNVIKNLLQRFEKATNRKYLIKDINEDFRLHFESYCSGEKYAPNTIARTLKFIKTICYHARHNGIETHFQLDGLKKKIEEVDKIYLNDDEITAIEKAKFKNDYLDNARDWLIISCETGQRVSDFLRFTKEQIKYREHIPIIEFRQIKTNKLMAIPLSKKVMDILNKRDGNFPRKISDQHYNEYIKEVCKQSGINAKTKGGKKDAEMDRKISGVFEKWELVTSHIGRRSFATNNYDKIPTSLLMYATGHSTEKMFLEYVGKEDTDKALQLAKHYTMLNK